MRGIGIDVHDPKNDPKNDVVIEKGSK